MLDLTRKVKDLGRQLGFDDVRISDTDLSEYAPYYRQWVARGFASNMDYMVRHGDKRLDPAQLHQGTTRLIVVRMNYLPPGQESLIQKKQSFDSNIGLIARYSLGRDYHKVVKKRLMLFQKKILKIDEAAQSSFRAFVDSGPVMEKPFAEKSGLGWQGKNGLIISKSGSWFFIGVLLTNLPLVCDEPVENSCGSCKACISICPTKAIIGEKQIDTHRCISYLTIENKGDIPILLRKQMGNRIFGCDDCQLICPWNKWSFTTYEPDFFARRGLESASLSYLASLSKDQFDKIFAGSAIMRAGYQGFLRNVAVALGNAIRTESNIKALRLLLQSSSPIVRSHAAWGLVEICKKVT